MLRMEPGASGSRMSTECRNFATKCCTKVCPEGITITDNAIIPLKERVVDRFFDPLSKLFRIFTDRKA